jgi:hypothetical protein
MKNELDAYLQAIIADYLKWSVLPVDADEIRKTVHNNMVVEFINGLKIQETPLYYKVWKGNSIHSFIVKVDGPKFKAGDILKAASWKVPAKNQARGNLFTGYQIRWTGAEYLR